MTGTSPQKNTYQNHAFQSEDGTHKLYLAANPIQKGTINSIQGKNTASSPGRKIFFQALEHSNVYWTCLYSWSNSNQNVI